VTDCLFVLETLRVRNLSWISVENTVTMKDSIPAFALGLSFGALSYLCVYIVQKVAKIDKLLAESKVCNLKLLQLEDKVQALTKEIDTRLNREESRYTVKENNSSQLSHCTISSVRHWTVTETHQWLEKTLSHFQLSHEGTQKCLEAFSGLDGSQIEDLVRNEAHDIGLDQKLLFMGVPHHVIPELSNELRRLDC